METIRKAKILTFFLSVGTEIKELCQFNSVMR